MRTGFQSMSCASRASMSRTMSSMVSCGFSALYFSRISPIFLRNSTDFSQSISSHPSVCTGGWVSIVTFEPKLATPPGGLTFPGPGRLSGAICLPKTRCAIFMSSKRMSLTCPFKVGKSMSSSDFSRTAASNAAILGASLSRTSTGHLSPKFAKFSFVCLTRHSAEYRNSSRYFASASVHSFASCSSRTCSTSSSLISVRPSSLICTLRRVATSFAETVRIPSKLTSNVTSILGAPFGAGGMPCKQNLPNILLSLAMGRSPCKTTTSISSCASSEVVKIFVAFVGTCVLRSITGVNMPPSVSTPSESGVTSRSMRSFTSPAIIAACSEAPRATASSGLME
mmetsp:Transcript_88087/g.222359  ORF Transcript_88087/g.222359 Transcript_88087/m.222359 type:complete len:340 (+) Transcript_88087:431-1450(+)